MYHKEPHLMFTFCFHVILIHLQIEISLCLLMYSVFTIPDTGRDSCVMQGEVDGCISLALPVIDLEQSQHFSDMPPLVISTGHCPEM